MTDTKNVFDFYQDEVKKSHARALSNVLDFYGGQKKLADRFSVVEGAVRSCIKAGVISRYLAHRVADDPASPFELKDLRVDYERLQKTKTALKPGPRPGQYKGWGAARVKKN